MGRKPTAAAAAAAVFLLLMQACCARLPPEQPFPEQNGDSVTVKTVEELWSALLQGKKHIALQEHLNIATGTSFLEQESSRDISSLLQGVHSIRGRCATPPSAQQLGIASRDIQLRQLKPLQCVISVNSQFLQTGSDPVWVDNIYIRHLSFATETEGSTVQAARDTQLWLTSVTFQGTGNSDQECSACALSVQPGAKVLCHDCIMTDFKVNTVAEMWSTSSVALENCIFLNNIVFDASTVGALLLARNSSVSDAQHTSKGGIFMRNSTGGNSLAPYTEIVLEGTGDLAPAVFLDYSEVSICAYQPGCDLCYHRQPSCRNITSEPLQNIPEGLFLSLQDAALHAIKQGGREEEAGSGSTSLHSSHVAIVAPVICAVGVLLVVLLLLNSKRLRSSTLLTKHSQARRVLHHTPSDDCHPAPCASGISPTGAACARGKLPADALEAPSNAYAAHNPCSAGARAAYVQAARAVFEHQPQSNGGSRLCSSSPVLNSDASLVLDSSGPGSSIKPHTHRKIPPVALPNGGQATLNQLMEFLNQQLDCFSPERPLLGKLLLLGPSERRCGGEAVVQFARAGETMFALKFFTSRRAFTEERELCEKYLVALKPYMPAILSVFDNADGSIVDPFGNKLPPFLLMRKGISLRDRIASAMDNSSRYQILARVCWLIDGLHAHGFVHRDIKPDNIIWDPGSSGWRLIDFGIVAPRGSSSQVAFTATYVAPEAASMYKRQVKEMVVDIGLDIWALGVMCLELLLERPAFGDVTDIDEVLDMLCDPHAPLPWEEGQMSEEDTDKLGNVLSIIRPLLHRDPGQRDSVPSFKTKLWNLTDGGE